MKWIWVVYVNTVEKILSELLHIACTETFITVTLYTEKGSKYTVSYDIMAGYMIYWSPMIQKVQHIWTDKNKCTFSTCAYIKDLSTLKLIVSSKLQILCNCNQQNNAQL